MTGQFDVSMVIVSHDRFADVWPGFFTLLFRFWPDRPYPLYLISNHITFPDERVLPLQVGTDLSWSQTLAGGLERIGTQYVLLMLEDFFLTAPVDTAHLRRLHATMVDKAAVYLRLTANPKPQNPYPEQPDIGFIAKGAAYRTSLQAAFWDRQVLLDLLQENESAWDFEIKGSRRSDRISEPFLSVCEGISPIAYRQTVRRGKWLPAAIQYFGARGVAIDISRRPVESEFKLRWQRSAARRFVGRVWRLAFRRPL
jgi:hypothetical protein